MDADAWDERYRSTELVWSAEANRFVVEVLADATPGTGLDLGCGEGRNAIWLAEQGWSMTGVDFSAEALLKAGSLARARAVAVTWVEADVVTWEPPDGLDLVLVAYLHLPGPERAAALSRAVRACRPDGLVVVVGHDRANLDGGYGGPQDPAVLLDAGEVAAELTEAGAAIDRAERVTRAVATDDGDRTALDTLVVARVGSG